MSTKYVAETEVNLEKLFDRYLEAERSNPKQIEEIVMQGGDFFASLIDVRKKLLQAMRELRKEAGKESPSSRSAARRKKAVG